MKKIILLVVLFTFTVIETSTFEFYSGTSYLVAWHKDFAIFPSVDTLNNCYKLYNGMGQLVRGVKNEDSLSWDMFITFNQTDEKKFNFGGEHQFYVDNEVTEDERSFALIICCSCIEINRFFVLSTLPSYDNSDTLPESIQNYLHSTNVVENVQYRSSTCAP